MSGGDPTGRRAEPGGDGPGLDDEGRGGLRPLPLGLAAGRPAAPDGGAGVGPGGRPAIGGLARGAQGFATCIGLGFTARRAALARAGVATDGLAVRPPVDFWPGGSDDPHPLDRVRTGDPAYDRLVNQRRAAAAAAGRGTGDSSDRVGRGLPASIHRRGRTIAGPRTAPGAGGMRPGEIRPAPNEATRLAPSSSAAMPAAAVVPRSSASAGGRPRSSAGPARAGRSTQRDHNSGQASAGRSSGDRFDGGGRSADDDPGGADADLAAIRAAIAARKVQTAAGAGAERPAPQSGRAPARRSQMSGIGVAAEPMAADTATSQGPSPGPGSAGAPQVGTPDAIARRVAEPVPDDSGPAGAPRLSPASDGAAHDVHADSGRDPDDRDDGGPARRDEAAAMAPPFATDGVDRNDGPPLPPPSATGGTKQDDNGPPVALHSATDGTKRDDDGPPVALHSAADGLAVRPGTVVSPRSAGDAEPPTVAVGQATNAIRSASHGNRPDPARPAVRSSLPARPVDPRAGSGDARASITGSAAPDASRPDHRTGATSGIDGARPNAALPAGAPPAADVATSPRSGSVNRGDLPSPGEAAEATGSALLSRDAHPSPAHGTHWAADAMPTSAGGDTDARSAADGLPVRFSGLVTIHADGAFDQGAVANRLSSPTSPATTPTTGQTRTAAPSSPSIPSRSEAAPSQLLTHGATGDRPGQKIADTRTPSQLLAHGTTGDGPGAKVGGDPGHRFLSALRSGRPDRPMPLPGHVRPLARALTGGATVRVVTGAATRRALGVVGSAAATIGRTIYLAEAPGSTPTQHGILAHELVHAARPSPLPRFFADPRPSAEERLAHETGHLVAARLPLPTASVAAGLPLATAQLGRVGAVRPSFPLAVAPVGASRRSMAAGHSPIGAGFRPDAASTGASPTWRTPAPPGGGVHPMALEAAPAGAGLDTRSGRPTIGAPLMRGTGHPGMSRGTRSAGPSIGATLTQGTARLGVGFGIPSADIAIGAPPLRGATASGLGAFPLAALAARVGASRGAGRAGAAVERRGREHAGGSSRMPAAAFGLQRAVTSLGSTAWASGNTDVDADAPGPVRDAGTALAARMSSAPQGSGPAAATAGLGTATETPGFRRSATPVGGMSGGGTVEPMARNARLGSNHGRETFGIRGFRDAERTGGAVSVPATIRPGGIREIRRIRPGTDGLPVGGLSNVVGPPATGAPPAGGEPAMARRQVARRKASGDPTPGALAAAGGGGSPATPTTPTPQAPVTPASSGQTLDLTGGSAGTPPPSGPSGGGGGGNGNSGGPAAATTGAEPAAPPPPTTSAFDDFDRLVELLEERLLAELERRGARFRGGPF